MRIVVTGGTGVVGRAAVPVLREAGHDVVAVCRSAPSAERSAVLGALPARGDVFDVASLTEACAGADAVVNLATAAPVGYAAVAPGAWRRHDRLRTLGVRNVVAAARRAGVRRVVQGGVSLLYADRGDSWIREDCALDINATTEPVAVAESLVQDYSCDSRAGVVLRFGTIVGDEPQTRHLLRAAGAGRPIGMGSPEGWAHVVHTDDLGTAVLAALHAPSGVYNVGAEPVRRRDLVQTFALAAGVDPVAYLHTAFLGPFLRRLAGVRLEPLGRSLRVCSEHFAAQTGWRPRRSRLDVAWLSEAARVGVPA